jgi:hypothetical protein
LSLPFTRPMNRNSSRFSGPAIQRSPAD